MSPLVSPSVTHALRNIVTVSADNVEEDVRMIPGPHRGRVYLTPWTVSQSAVRPPLRADLGMICRVSGASIWRAAHLYAAETLPRWQTVSLLITVNSRWVHLEHLYSALTGGKLKLTSDFKYLRLFCSHAELKRRSQQVFKKRKRWLTCFGNSKTLKKKHKGKP